MQSLILKLQAEVEARKQQRWDLPASARAAIVGSTLCLAAFFMGAKSAESGVVVQWKERLGVIAPEGALELQRVEIDRLKRIHENSAKFGIPADLAERIEDIALAEGIEPHVAFGLVRAESEFNRRAVSPVGAVGLTQLMPSTARYFKNGVNREDLFDRDTNLRIGFRYLRTLVVKYNGNLELALLAYNRGPDRVDQLLRAGQDPNNGYVSMVLGRGKRARW
ncbi:transglycosylase SLT domain-containing protein [Longimicrobium sp.]|uniref:transglycosylase SLT domain-containing protein n=1 Tax=Longimicrobium sp. TaxID=2029185 RepID=UPI002E2FC80D|nr:transglycosylase SLT domain-containing protein [Longimicrobium sp.]HEX6041774.1 transglycosylase SLT domain-containing protein [Longimicrobium sp.]